MEGRVVSSGRTQTIGYLNTEPEAVPPFAMLELHDESDNVVATGTVSVKVRKPTADGSHYMLDDGKGSGSASDVGTGGSARTYGNGVMALESLQWVYFLGDFDALEAWVTEVGPEEDHWDATTAGSGFVYAGQKDEAEHRIQVRQLAAGGGAEIIQFTLTSVTCSGGTGTGTGTGTGSSVIAYGEATKVFCGGSLPAGLLRIYDDEGCWFVGNCQMLEGLSGKAVKMKDDSRGCYWSLISLPCLGVNC